jgi:hypothetical protein
MNAQEILTSDHSSLQYGGGGCLPCSSQGTILCNMDAHSQGTYVTLRNHGWASNPDRLDRHHPSAAGPFTLCLVYPLLKLLKYSVYRLLLSGSSRTWSQLRPRLLPRQLKLLMIR